MPDLLDRYFAQEKASQFVWSEGNGDCILFLIGWGKVLKGVDFGISWRGRYQNKEGARALIDLRGGLIANMVEYLGPPRMGSPARRGDVGVLHSKDWTFGMIYDGDTWHLRDYPRGIRQLRVSLDVVWDMGFAS